MAQITHRYILEESKLLAPKVLHLSFKREDNEPFPFIAGQFITLHIETPAKKVHRSYSIANSPGNNRLEIACAYVENGIASKLLFNLKPGDTIEAGGPHGLFVLKDEQPKRYLFIATGTGVTPYRSMLKEIQRRLKESSPHLKVALIFGVRTREELLFKDEFLNFAKEHPNFEFHACYSRESQATLSDFEHHGHVQVALAKLQPNPNEDIVYLCGNPNMIDDTFTLLTELGFDKKNVRREKYLFSH